jgi:cell division protein ZapA (FtsZ GTPase activity inhibitor)
MNNESDPGQERNLQERIVSLIRANQQARKTPLTDEELQKLKAAARRLDQMLKAAADEDQRALKNAAARLDQLLKDMAAGKDVTNDFKRRGSD